MAEEKDDWLDDLEGPEEKESDLGQSDIDALFASSDDPTPPSSDADELGQADIDSLLSGDDLSSSQLQNEDNASGNLDQSDIEALLSSGDSTGQDQPFFDPDQDEIDKLFSEPAAEGGEADSQLFAAEEIDFGGAFDLSGSTSSQATSPPSSDFDDHEFRLEADIPDIPDIPEVSGGWNDNQSFLEQETVALPEAEGPVQAEEAAAALAGAVSSANPKHAKWRALLANRKLVFAGGGGLTVLILLVAAIFFFKGGEAPDEKTIHNPPAEVAGENSVASEPSLPETPPQELPAQSAETTPQEPDVLDTSVASVPTLSDQNLVMPSGASELAITLDGKDPENQPLEYEFQSMPAQGQIAGHAPLLVYTAKPDFAGQDSFTVRATNGKQYSPTATVTITREAFFAIPEPPTTPVVEQGTSEQASPPAGETTPSPMPEGISARDASYTISKSLVVPWEKIWRKVNSQPYSQEVGVEIVRGPRHGTLGALRSGKSVYRPDDGFSGKDSFDYRFTLGELRSATKSVAISVQSKNVSPELHIAPYAAVYSPGDTVILNASQTRDDSRGTLQFKWEQLSGVPVVLKSLNNEGSQISFVAPATFNTVSNPGVVLRVTATDHKGWSVSRELQIKTQSRRNTAIWR